MPVASDAKILEKTFFCTDRNGYTTVKVDLGGEIATFADQKKAIVFSDRLNCAIEAIFEDLNV